MSFSPRSGAPRLIEWTGERCVPWSPDVQVMYEHLHRYMWAAQVVCGQQVLDLASGEGFGAAILAGSAQSVIGVDVDQQAVAHSRLNYALPGLAYEVADAADLSRFDPDRFDAVVAFEMIEHVEDQARVLAEIERVLRPDGLLILSTPDRMVYSEGRAYDNPFHVRELTYRELMDMLGDRFQHTAAWGQRTITGSSISGIEGDFGAEPARTFFVTRSADAWSVAPGLSPMYIIAVASNGTIPRLSEDSTLADGELSLLRQAERDRDLRWARVNDELQEAQGQLGESLRERNELRARVRDQEAEIDHRLRRLLQIQARARELGLAHDQLRAELTEAGSELARMRGSVTWRLFQRARMKLYGALGGERSVAARGVQALLRSLGRALRADGAAPDESPGQIAQPPIAFPEFEHPDVSLVIPVHRHPELTRRCLESISEYTSHISYEVILIDDFADDATREVLAAVRGARLLVNEFNVGYLRSVNRGARIANGRWLVLCNNDIEVRPGWLEAMVDCGDSSPDIAIVTPKYLYPDGSLNEAGAIIWRDGTGWNYGRGARPSECHYEFRREVDYGSAAALLVRSAFWSAAGGYDERFLPMYYEDADLGFAAREHGMRVMYEPRAHVVHVEGASAGTDTSSGHKRHQEDNRSKFVAKWGHRLEREQLANDPLNVRMASRRGSGARVLVVDHLIPQWNRDSGSLRMRGIIFALVELGCRVTFLPDDLLPRLPYMTEFQRLGVEVLYGPLHVEAELTTIGSDLTLAICSRPHTTSRLLDMIRGAAPGVPVVYDTVDLHWVRESRRMAAALGERSPGLGPRAVALRELELALIRATDATLVVTDAEREVVCAEVPGAEVRVIPNVHPVRGIAPGPESRSGILFVGSFEHPPNVDAALMLVGQVMPIVWQELGDVRVTIAGAAAPAVVQALAGDRVEVAGWVEDLDSMLDSRRALVAPLTYGAGMKGKVTQALAYGLPVVTTPTGAEGLGALDGRQILIGESPAAIAERVIRLLRDDQLWVELSEAGRRLVDELCSPMVVRQRLAELLEWAGSTGSTGFTGATGADPDQPRAVSAVSVPS